MNHLGTTVPTEPVGSGLISHDPHDQAVAQLTLDLAKGRIARVPRELVGLS